MIQENVRKAAMNYLLFCGYEPQEEDAMLEQVCLALDFISSRLADIINVPKALKKIEDTPYLDDEVETNSLLIMLNQLGQRDDGSYEFDPERASLLVAEINQSVSPLWLHIEPTHVEQIGIREQLVLGQDLNPNIVALDVKRFLDAAGLLNTIHILQLEPYNLSGALAYSKLQQNDQALPYRIDMLVNEKSSSNHWMGITLFVDPFKRTIQVNIFTNDTVSQATKTHIQQAIEKVFPNTGLWQLEGFKQLKSATNVEMEASILYALHAILQSQKITIENEMARDFIYSELSHHSLFRKLVSAVLQDFHLPQNIRHNLMPTAKRYFTGGYPKHSFIEKFREE